MKKLLIVLIALLCLSCVTLYADENETELEYENTMSELSDKFTYKTGYVLRNDVLVEYVLLNRGEEVIITDQDEDYYYIDYKNLILAVSKNRVRTEKEEPFEEFEGYTRKGSGVYSDLELSDMITSFGLNDRVKVIDSFLGVLYVEYEEGKFGYMSTSSVSEKEIVVYTYTPPANSGSDYSDYSGGGGGGGDSSPSGGGSPDPGPAPSSGDGEDISLSFYYQEYETVLVNNSNTIKAMVLADSTMTFIAKLQRGDIIKIIEEDDDSVTILISGRKGRIPRKYVRYDDESAYESWSGYARGSSVIYADFDMNERIRTNSTNDPIKVIDEVDGMYVVEMDDGTIGYMKQSAVSKEKLSTYVPPAPSYSSSDGGGSSDYSGGGDSGGGGGGGSAPAPEPEPEWTDPVL